MEFISILFFNLILSFGVGENTVYTTPAVVLENEAVYLELGASGQISGEYTEPYERKEYDLLATFAGSFKMDNKQIDTSIEYDLIEQRIDGFKAEMTIKTGSVFGD